MKAPGPRSSERTLIVAPRGRDAVVAESILREARLHARSCASTAELLHEIQSGGGDVAIVTEEAIRNTDLRAISSWVALQAAWSDFPFVVLTEHGGGIERNPTAARLTEILGNVTFLERPFHPTTLVSVVQSSLRGRRRQHECRRLNEELESRVSERTAELAAANRQLLAQIEERERVESTLNQLQRLEAVGQLTSGVAHDFNNLLTVVLGNIEFLEKGLAAAGIDGKLKQRLGYMRIAAERGAKLTDQLLSFSRRQHLQPKPLDLNGAIQRMQALLQSTMGGSIRVETRMNHELWPALADPTQLELAVLNLAINARDAMEGSGGNLSVETQNVTLGPAQSPEEPGPGEYVAICVRDTGSGMTAAVRAKAFEPFFTTKEVGKGSGLGLSQVLGFAKQSGGGVRIDTRKNEGTSVHVYLPRAEASLPLAIVARGVTDAVRSTGGITVLLVDDDNPVREVTAAILQDLGYRVVEAGSGGAALELLEREPRIGLMLIDFAMPGMNGAEVARRARTTRPTLPILFVTGYADRSALADVNEAQIVSKPFIDDELATKIHVALAQGASSRPYSAAAGMIAQAPAQ